MDTSAKNEEELVDENSHDGQERKPAEILNSYIGAYNFELEN